MAAYIGRFAPSPTGALHLGSLYAALASYLDARANNGQWLVRMEDIDPPREVPGAADTILKQLDNHGLHWHGSVLYQSQRLTAYRDAIDALENLELVYSCQCTRSRLRSLNGVYDGHCRSQQNLSAAPGTESLASIRIKISSAKISWQDLIHGRCTDELALTCGDFILVRRDGLFAYQLAVSIDDAYQSINHVIRGDDLLDSTARQIYLHEQLGFEAPRYGHIPVLKDAQGDKLSKQRFASSIEASNPGGNIEHCLTLLGLSVPAELSNAPVAQLLDWATQQWSRSTIPNGTLAER